MLVSWWDLAVPLAIRLCVLKVLQTLLSSFDDLFHADKNFSLVYHCAQPAPHPLLKCRWPTRRWKMPSLCWQRHVFLKTSDYLLCLDALARLLGPARLQYLLLFLAFVRAAHYWTETHPEIAFEDDINKLLATHEALADCILNDPEARDSISQSLLDELPALRLKADKAIGLLAAIVDSSDDAIVSKTLDGVITSWNAGAERLFGYTASEAVGQHISLIIPVNRRDEETVIIERIKQGRTNRTLRHRSCA